MTNDENEKTPNDERMRNPTSEVISWDGTPLRSILVVFGIRYSGFIRHSSFVIYDTSETRKWRCPTSFVSPQAPWHDLAILLHDLALVVDQDQGVVRNLVGMLLMPLASKRKDAPGVVATTRVGEDFGFFAWYV